MTNDWRPGADRAALRARAALFADIRAFFAARGVLEVDTPLLASYGVSDPGIEPLCARGAAGAVRFLQTSPEFAMKRLLAADSGPIYQLGKAFRDGEVGARHNPEFTLLEWYRPGFAVDALIEEVAALLRHGLDRPALRQRTFRYRDLFHQHLAIDPLRAATKELAAVARTRLDCGSLDLDRNGWLDLLMSHCIEPSLPGDELVFVTDYPAAQAALAKTVQRDGERVAERFELYLNGIELANGYRELLDPEELERRAATDNARRRAAGQHDRDLDPRLLAAMRAGLPDCSGVALGVDRLLMLRLGASALEQVLPFDWSRS